MKIIWQIKINYFFNKNSKYSISLCENKLEFSVFHINLPEMRIKENLYTIYIYIIM